MPKNLQLYKIDVLQGNGNGKSINFDSKNVLATSDLGPCVAILIIDENLRKCFMIHSDSNRTSGKGGVSLENGFKQLGLDENACYKINLIGAMDKEALENKKSVIENLLPNSIITCEKNGESAYISYDGSTASTRKALAEKMNVDEIEFLLSANEENNDEDLPQFKPNW